MCIRIVEEADKQLDKVRKRQSNAGGLIICRGIAEADALAELMEDNLGITPVIVHSDNVAATAEIEAFAMSEVKWILSVGMVTEGTDIPRLRVAVHLHTTMTLMHFRQFCGRVVRWQDGLTDEHQESYIFIPQYGPLHLMAQDVEKEVALSLFEGEEGKGKEKKACGECGQMPCVCPCIVCGVHPCECPKEEYFRAISSEEEQNIGSTSRGDDYTAGEQATAEDLLNNEKLRSKYSEVQLLMLARICNDPDFWSRYCDGMSDEEFDAMWEHMNEKKNRR